MILRLAAEADLPAVCRIYDRAHDAEERGAKTTGWIRGVYPVPETARESLAEGSLYVAELEGEIVATGRINQTQGEEYAAGRWSEDVPPEQVLVLHTMMVAPEYQGRGIARFIVSEYAAMARQMGCTWLRLDTNRINAPARALYRKLGFREVGEVLCNFCGLPDVCLVLLEKRL